MLRTLSIRNARRQAGQYLLYFVSIIGAVALIYGFNALVFSDAIKELSKMISQTGDNELGYMIIIFSFIVVIILGWFVGYMMNFMLRKRSQELSTYMILGIDKKQIIRMFFLENCIIGLASLIVGWILGVFIAEILEAIVINVFGGNYSLSAGFSIQAAGMTLIYYCIIYLIALIGSNKKLKKMKLIDLIYYKDKNETTRVKDLRIGVGMFYISIICGVASFYLFSLPTGNISDMFTGFLLAVLCQVFLFIGVSPTMYKILGKNKHWKYKKTHLLLYRLLTSKINSMSIVLGFISALFTLSIACIGVGMSFYNTMEKSIDLHAFDISILHMDEQYDFTEYTQYLSDTAKIDSSHIYSLYTDHDKTFMEVRNNVLSKYFSEIRNDLSPEDYIFMENQYDTFMKYSDYSALREILGLEAIEMDERSFIIHCMPYLKDSYDEYIYNGYKLTLANKDLSCAGVYKDDISQYGGYGNGQEYVLVVPDKLIDSLDVVYSLYVANTRESISSEYLNTFRNKFDKLEIINHNITKSVDDGFMTRIIHKDKDYVSGRFAAQTTSQSIVLILPFFYLALIVSIIGTVILSVQLISENNKNAEHYSMLKTLGMSDKVLNKTLRNHILLYFSTPLIPAILLGGGLISVITRTLSVIAFDVPVFYSIKTLVVLTVVVTIALFMIIYCIYAFVTYIAYKREVLNRA
ncbi:ABC transporter permease [[Clostridium] sordellii]|uniref:ABC-type transport system, permease Tn916-like,CTn1-Orf8 n=1 Tax=Paraclostridium sordellii TaxID=1505 RepID=A0ABM9RNI5_PARSO|nr:ABC transporter permease [Paeniclostridium sordellii]CEJ73615.1 ABC-type transport system, permease Tn916-like,CTn1-Orf8 [[Clostridium] sordellii] [Paeniclostridium sordellii]CEN69163.1 ABC transporter permease [[Clostridium] sordellii] [Paeniclostridium sordellii]CEN72431.1 ABC transporter permease [[Clostridium] sordellii] [Paeniclostridium sordellii]CEO23862.1 ABC transporter permease [[Clostridium] sordellii] [Paeniclostridium sordellii]CEP75976.1 ABC transporter permease [[Clostridium]